MQVLDSRLAHLPIHSLRSGASLGFIDDPIIDPRQLKIIAFYCSNTHIPEPAILHSTDIREIGNMGVIIDDEEVIMPPDDLVRTQQVMDYNFVLLDKLVIDTQKRRLGKIESYSIDVSSFYIVKLNVRQSAFKNLWGSSLSIDRTQIVEVTDSKIVVQSPEIREESPQHILQNPFRQHGGETTQPNMIRSHQED
ncbi:MAG TPA: hypothetical protein VGS28_00375 [Candidatus Saccharimonadales bacterium]|nr:hypothetical protein [Candidatus Saccharimonadales bacterium]